MGVKLGRLLDTGRRLQRSAAQQCVDRELEMAGACALVDPLKNRQCIAHQHERQRALNAMIIERSMVIRVAAIRIGDDVMIHPAKRCAQLIREGGSGSTAALGPTHVPNLPTLDSRQW